MHRLKILPLILVLLAAGCGADEGAQSQAAAMQPGTGPQEANTGRGGTITVGDDSWTIVPSTQCSVFPGNVVSISGHAAEDPSLEIVIDVGGPDQVVIGSGRDALWHAGRDTLQVQVDGKHVQGTATFTRGASGVGESRQGSFDVRC